MEALQLDEELRDILRISQLAGHAQYLTKTLVFFRNQFDSVAAVLKQEEEKLADFEQREANRRR